MNPKCYLCPDRASPTAPDHLLHQNILYRALETTQCQKHKRRISLLKLVKFLSAAPDNLLRAIKSLSAGIEQSDGFHKALLRYCCYDQRKRPNFSEKWSNLA